jgi:hypothetical protein
VQTVLTVLTQKPLFPVIISFRLAFWGARMLPTLVQQMMLVKLFIQTDPTVLPIGLVLSLISNLALSGVSSGAHCVLRDTLHPATGGAGCESAMPLADSARDSKIDQIIAVIDPASCAAANRPTPIISDLRSR